ncbi:MAG: DNA translocase FtsK [Lachnospiraceae bacterium]|nr:DNA translocase FtsK [Lachnospiraceae bacterium]MBQ2467950.1 DNA translocase FtsK [Lachnospiraceae bacterium]
MATNSSKTNKKNTAKNTQATKKSTGRTSSQKTNSAKKRQTVVIEEGLEQENTLRTELILWGALAISLILLLSNFGFGGVVGNAISSFVFGLIGLLAYAFPIALLLGTFFMVSNKDNNLAIPKLIAMIAALFLVCTFVELLTHESAVCGALMAYHNGFEFKIGGGLIGGLLAQLLYTGFGLVGAYIITIIGIIVCMVIITEKSTLRGLKRSARNMKKRSELHSQERASRAKRKHEHVQTRQVEPEAAETDSTSYRGVTMDTLLADPIQEAGPSDEVNEIHMSVEDVNRVALRSDGTDQPSVLPAQPKINTYEPTPTPVAEPTPASKPAARKTKVSEPKVAEAKAEPAAETPVMNMAPKTDGDYQFPPINLLKQATHKGGGNSKASLQETANKLQQTLKNFGVNVTITDVSCGPAVTRYEMQPEMGVKVSKIVNLADDIKLNLAASDIRIEAPIPGKAAVGIEVPNKDVTMVSFRELVESKEFQSSKSRIAFSAGRDIGGNVMVADIAKMPHVLIAGTTGSGKSVCINTIIMSILYKAHPDDVKFIMIDPKVVELSVYNGIPHLLCPVVTDPKKAAGALNWAVKEMTDRYQKFADVGVRDMKGYNSKIHNGVITVEDANGNSVDVATAKMPQIVVIVDELADLMMVASNEVEEAICRLAQLARAAGIHLVIATQRPSVDVITGLIKANMPSRIAFAVSSAVDSRTILDSGGAEKLLGKGDMLYYPQGFTKPLRVQGAFVSDDEVSAVVDFIKQHNKPSDEAKEHASKVTSEIEAMPSGATAIGGGEGGFDNERDSYFEASARLIVDKEKASIGMLQRNFKIGFNRAARIMDQLEEFGVVGPEEGTKPRKVLLTTPQLEELLGSSDATNL